MDGLQETWETLSDALSRLDEVKHVDLWNRNVEYMDEDAAWARPAVFVEFGHITWTCTKEDSFYRGYGTVRLHIVTDWQNGGQAGAWEVVDAVRRCVNDLNLPMACSGSDVNHDHEEILETIEEYAARFWIDLSFADRAEEGSGE